MCIFSNRELPSFLHTSALSHGRPLPQPWRVPPPPHPWWSSSSPSALSCPCAQSSLKSRLGAGCCFSSHGRLSSISSSPSRKLPPSVYGACSRESSIPSPSSPYGELALALQFFIYFPAARPLQPWMHPSLLLLAVNRLDALSSLEASSSTLVVVKQHVIGSVIFGQPGCVVVKPQ
jgi:hypothetical protein